MNKNFCAGLLLFFPLVFGQALSASELMSSATQLGPKRIHAEIFFRHLAQQDLDIAVVGRGSASETILESQGSGNGTIAKVSFQPLDIGLRTYLLGGLSSYDLKVPSGTFSNSYASANPGWVFGGGLKYTLVPYTIVTPALALDLSAIHSRYQLTKFSSGDRKTIGAAELLLTVWEIQAALTASKKFIFDWGKRKGSADPYLGIKVIRTRVSVDDIPVNANYSGTRTSVAPFFGFKLKPYPNAGLVVEGSVVGEYSAAAGLTLGF